MENAQKKQKLSYHQKHAAGDVFTVGSLVPKKDFRKKDRGVERWTIAGKVHLQLVLSWEKVSTPSKRRVGIRYLIIHVSVAKPMGLVLLSIAVNVYNSLQAMQWSG